MPSLFQSLEAQELKEDEKPMFDVLKASLYYPTTANVLPRRLADDIVFFCDSADVEDVYEGILTIAWYLIFDMICYIPSDHLWDHDTYELSWQELPCFSMQLDAHMDRVREKDTEFQNLNSFAARLSATDVVGSDRYPLVELRYALEESVDKSSDHLLWVASEWLIRCADQIYGVMHEVLQLPERRGWWTPGKAFEEKDGVTPFSIGRWNLWKERLSEEKRRLLSSSNSETGIPDLVERLHRALQKMNEAEWAAELKINISKTEQ
ncbi:hypothetical protein F4802DRAFT_614939 [Xylaria palmicola]|nr:hypothetical protein F4802DRAFT_614939 [Xylaria palmicola]